MLKLYQLQNILRCYQHPFQGLFRLGKACFNKQTTNFPSMTLFAFGN